jgi:hypothetical protein
LLRALLRKRAGGEALKGGRISRAGHVRFPALLSGVSTDGLLVDDSFRVGRQAASAPSLTGYLPLSLIFATFILSFEPQQQQQQHVLLPNYIGQKGAAWQNLAGRALGG